MSGQRFIALLDVLQQVAEVAVAHAQRTQLMNEANTLYRAAIEGRDDRAAFLLALDERVEALSPALRQRLLTTVHVVLRDQIAFSGTCLDILERRNR